MPLAEERLQSLKQRLTQIPFAGRFALLFFFLLGSIVFYPYAETSGPGLYAFRIVGALVILITVWAVTFSRQLLLLVVALAIPSIVQHLLHQHAQGVLPLVNRLLAIAFDLLIVGILARHIFQTREPTSETIFGALCIYLLLGFLFTGIYGVIVSLHPNAFRLDPVLNPHTIPDRFDFIYFSFGTLTELGTAGITAVAPAARSTSLLEAILGILYMAVLISRLINAYRAPQAPTLGKPPEGSTPVDYPGTSNPPQHPYRQRDHRTHQLQDSLHGNPYQAEGKQHQPHHRVQNQRHQRHRPAPHEQQAPKQKLHHESLYASRSTRVP